MWAWSIVDTFGEGMFASVRGVALSIALLLVKLGCGSGMCEKSKDLCATDLFKCSWSPASTSPTCTGWLEAIQISVGEEAFERKLLYQQPKEGVLLEKPDQKDQCVFELSLHTKLEEVLCQFSDVFSFIVSEAKFIEVYIDNSYLLTSQGEIVDEEELDGRSSSRKFCIFNHQVTVSGIKPHHRFLIFKFLGLQGDKSTVYINEWAVKVNLTTPSTHNMASSEISGLASLLASKLTPLSSKNTEESFLVEKNKLPPHESDSEFSLVQHIDQKIEELKHCIENRICKLESKIDSILNKISCISIIEDLAK